MNLRDKMIGALEIHAKANIEKHIMNVEVFLENPVGVGEHSSVIESIETQLGMIEKYEGQLDVLANYFPKSYDEAVPCICGEDNENCQCDS